MSSLFSSLPCTLIQTHLVLNILIKSSICVYMTRRGVEEKSRIISASCTKDMKSSSFRHEIGNWEWMKSCWRWHKRKNMRETTANVSWKCHNFATKLSKNNLSLFCFAIVRVLLASFFFFSSKLSFWGLRCALFYFCFSFSLGHNAPCPNWPPWALMGWALMGRQEPREAASWWTPGPHGPGHNGPLWALMAPVGPDSLGHHGTPGFPSGGGAWGEIRHWTRPPAWCRRPRNPR